MFKGHLSPTSDRKFGSSSRSERIVKPEIGKECFNCGKTGHLVHYIYIFYGSSHLTEFWQVQNSLCVRVLRCHRPPTLAALLHGTRVVGISQTVRC